jgi:hypothetical protein
MYRDQCNWVLGGCTAAALLNSGGPVAVVSREMGGGDEVLTWARFTAGDGAGMVPTRWCGSAAAPRQLGFGDEGCTTWTMCGTSSRTRESSGRVQGGWSAPGASGGRARWRHSNGEAAEQLGDGGVAWTCEDPAMAFYRWRA